MSSRPSQGARSSPRPLPPHARGPPVAAAFAMTRMGTGFLPEFHEGSLTVQANTLPGTSLAKSNEIGTRVERILMAQPEVVATARRTGRAEYDEHVQGVEAAEIDVGLRETSRSRDELLVELRRQFSTLPGTNVTIGQPISHRIDHMLSGTRANIAVKIFGDDLAVLRALAAQVQAQMAGVRGVVDLSTEMQTEIPALRVKVDPERASRHGLASGAVAQTLQTARVGRPVGQVIEGQIAVPLIVRYSSQVS